MKLVPLGDRVVLKQVEVEETTGLQDLLVGDMRNVLLYNGEPHYIALAIWTVVGIVISALGTRIIYKHENSYVKVI